MASLLTDRATRLDLLNLPACFVVDCPTDGAHGVHVLDLTPRTKGLAWSAHRDVDVHAHRTLFHLRVTRTDGHEDAAQLVHVLTSLITGADVGTTDDLHERNAGTIEIHQRVVAAMDTATRPTEVSRLARVFFQVRALDADAHVTRQHQVPVDVQRLVVLADLIRLRQVGIEVVLTVERARLHRAIEGESKSNGQFHGLAIEHGQRTRKSQRDGIDVGVRIIAEAIGATGEQLGCGVELHVNLETDHHLPAIGQRCGIGWCTRGVAHRARSNSAATRNIVASPSAGASTCTPTGNECAPVPNGTLIAA